MGITDFSTLVQALTGIVALILSIVTALQSKKIKELEDVTHRLTDVVTELKRQTTELAKQSATFERRLNLEKNLSLPDRMPIFERHGIFRNPNQNKFTVYLENVGRRAINVSIIQEKETEQFYYIAPVAGNVEPKQVLTIDIHYTTSQYMQDVRFLFTITSRNSNGILITQHITKLDAEDDFVITTPTDDI